MLGLVGVVRLGHVRCGLSHDFFKFIPAEANTQHKPNGEDPGLELVDAPNLTPTLL